MLFDVATRLFHSIAPLGVHRLVEVARHDSALANVSNGCHASVSLINPEERIRRVKIKIYLGGSRAKVSTGVLLL